MSGEGIEFAELREFRAGECVRRVNWRASARRGRLLVSDRLPERSSDVVLFLDSLTEAATEEESTLDLAVRAVAGLVGAYLRQRDRVGLLSFGGELEWVLLPPVRVSTTGSSTQCFPARVLGSSGGATRA